MIRLHQDDVASWQNLGPQESRQVTPVRPSPTPPTPREVSAQPGQQTEQWSAVLLTARQAASQVQPQHLPVASVAAAHTLSPDPTISNTQEAYQVPQANTKADPTVSDTAEEFSVLCTIFPLSNMSSSQMHSEARLQHMPAAFAVTVHTLSPASTSLAESDAPQAISIVGDSQEESEAIGEMCCKVAVTPEDFPKALASPEDQTGIYRGHCKADQCAPNPKSPTPTVLHSPYYTITAPCQRTPALSFLGFRTPRSIYRGRRQFSATPDNQDKSEGVAQRRTHPQRADRVGTVSLMSDSDRKVRRQVQDKSDTGLVTGEVQHYSQQYKQAVAHAMLAHVSEAGGQEDRHRADPPTHLQVPRRHATSAPTTEAD